MSTVKIICCDIDGTLVRNDKSLSDENIRWIHRAVHEAGVHFCLVSGRMITGVRPFYEKMGIIGPVSCYNGGMLLDEQGNIVDDHRVPHELALRWLALRDKYKLDTIIFDGMTWYLETKDCYAYKPKVKIYECDCQVGIFTELLNRFDTNKVLFMSPDRSVLDAAMEEVKRITSPGEVFIYRNADFLEIMGGDYDKGTAIDALSAYYGVEKADIMAIGDDYNDVPMLQKAGFSVAMENSVPEAKAVARYITDTNENDGVAKIIKRLVFNL